MKAEEMIEKYGISLVKYGANAGKIAVSRPPKDSKLVDEIASRKQEIIEYIQTKEKEAKKKYEEKKILISQIEGLAEIEKARETLRDWQEALNKSFDDVGGLGVGPKPEYDFEAAYKKYPRAAAYLKAKSYSDKSNHELASIGDKALREVIYGDYEKAMGDMEGDLKAFSDRHAWD